MTSWWLTEIGIESYDSANAVTLFKWVLFTRTGEPYLAAMPLLPGFDYHMQLMAETARRLGWCDEGDAARFLKRDGNDFPEAGIEVLGGGTRLDDGSVRNCSFRFGAIPERYVSEVAKVLGIE